MKKPASDRRLFFMGGKSGGVRVIYYSVTAASQIRMLLIYKKGVQDDLTSKQKAVLRKINERWE